MRTYQVSQLGKRKCGNGAWKSEDMITWIDATKNHAQWWAFGTGSVQPSGSTNVWLH